MGGGIIWGILVLVLLVAVTVAVTLWATTMAKRTPKSGGAVHADPTPEEILRRRYASGEIDDEEFKHRLGALKSQ